MVRFRKGLLVRSFQIQDSKTLKELDLPVFVALKNHVGTFAKFAFGGFHRRKGD